MNIRASSTFQPGNIAALEESITARVIAAVTQGTEIVTDEARALAPVETGELRDSIAMVVTLQGREVIGTVYAGAEHAAFVEFGTGLIGEANPHGPLPTEGVPITGSWIYDYKRQNWQGMLAQPFMRPAFDNSQRAILDCFSRQGFRV